MALGNQACSPTWADFPIAPPSKKHRPILRLIDSSNIVNSDRESKSQEPVEVMIMAKAKISSISPARLIKNACILA